MLKECVQNNSCLPKGKRGKQIITFGILLITLALVSFVFASEIVLIEGDKLYFDETFEEKNRLYDLVKEDSIQKYYDSANEKISLSNEGNLLTEAELISNSCDEGLRNCEAVISLNNYRPLKLDYLNFKRLVEGSLVEGRVRNFEVYVNTTGKISRYAVSCKDETCNNEFIEKSFIYPDWSLYDWGFLDEEAVLKIKVEKSPHHTIDWLISLFGVELKEWALWYGDGGETWQNVTLNSPADNNITLDGSVDFNCTASNNETTIENISLLFYNGTAWVVNDSSDTSTTWYHSTQYDSSGNQYSYYTKHTFTGLDDMIEKVTAQQRLSVTTGVCLYTKMIFQYENISDETVTICAGTTEGSWSLKTYTNPHPDELVNSIVFQMEGTTFHHAKDFYIYSFPVDTLNFTKSISEDTLWTCSACDSDGDCSVVNATENRTVLINDPPSITINSPLNQSYPLSVTFNITATDDIAISSCSYSLDGGANISMTNPEGNYWNATNSSMTESEHTVNFYCNDTSGNLNNTESVIFSISNSAPEVPVQLLPANQSNYAMESTITFVWNNSVDVDGDNVTYDLYIYNESDMAVEHLIHANTSIAEGIDNTSMSIKLSDYTSIDDDYYWHVRANDSEDVSGWSNTRTFQYANWTITFNLTDSVTGGTIPDNTIEISCDNGFDVSGKKNPYTSDPNAFASGTWECTFSGVGGYYSKEDSFTADNDKTVNIPMSVENLLTSEEHTWLEWLYNCWNGGSCETLLENINETTTNTWKRITKTDRGVVTQEDFVSNTLNSTSNITINYTIDIPYKEGYDVGEYLPLRMFFWFTTADKTQCYNQDKATDTNRAENHYCFPLMAETLGPNNGSVTFTVDLRPNLADGTYNITRAIEIDPIIDGKQVWTNYGQEDVGQIKVEESNENTLINFETTNEVMPKTVMSGITGAIIGAGERLLSGWQLVVVIGMFIGLFAVFIISKTMLKLKE